MIGTLNMSILKWYLVAGLVWTWTGCIIQLARRKWGWLNPVCLLINIAAWPFGMYVNIRNKFEPV